MPGPGNTVGPTRTYPDLLGPNQGGPSMGFFDRLFEEERRARSRQLQPVTTPTRKRKPRPQRLARHQPNGQYPRLVWVNPKPPRTRR